MTAMADRQPRGVFNEAAEADIFSDELFEAIAEDRAGSNRLRGDQRKPECKQRKQTVRPFFHFAIQKSGWVGMNLVRGILIRAQ